MRIKDLATRATKLLTGNAYMVFDNGTKVEKVDYAELAKQIITEYNTQTLAGSAQSVKSALDALNSNINSPSITTIEALNTYLTNLPSAGRGIVMVNGTVANALIERNASAIATVARIDNVTADMSLYSLGGNYLGIIRYNFSTSTVTKQIEAAQKSDVEALNNIVNNELITGRSSSLSSIQDIILENYVQHRTVALKFNPNDNVGPFGSSSVNMLINMSSVNYGTAQCYADNPNMPALFGMKTGNTWKWYKPTLTEYTA